MSGPAHNFWTALPRPFFALAPMEDVTDAAFRRVIARHGKPHVFYTEFTSGDGLVLADERGRRHLMKRLEYGEDEHPIVAQLFGSTPEHMAQAAELAVELGFDGLDINMGCPVKAIVEQGCGAALIKNPARAKEIIRAAKRGVAGAIPVSVKTRIGYTTNDLPEWLPALLEEDLAAVTIHARTRAEMSKVPAQWERVAQAVSLRDMHAPQTLIIGNGDVRDLADARQKAARPPAGGGCDGVMLGRAIYGNPWLFRNMDIASPYVATPRERVDALIEHIEAFDELLTGFASYATMKKHFKAYISGWPGAADLRARLMETEDPNATLRVLRDAILPA